MRDAITGTALVEAAVLCTLPLATIAIERFVVVAVFAIVWDQIPVLVDSYASMVLRAKGLDFGRLRAWGSIGVVISTAAAGWTIMATRPPLALLYVAQCSQGSSGTGLLLAPMIMIAPRFLAPSR